MKTGQLAKMLQEADPSGEGFIMNSDGGVPRFFEEKEGYWDGAYRYVDDKGRLVYSIKDHKVDVHSNDLEDAVWSNLDCELTVERRKATLEGRVYVIDREEWLERIKAQFVFHEGVPEEFKSTVLDKAIEDFERWLKFTLDSDVEWVNRAMADCASGVQFFQSKSKDSWGWTTWTTNKDQHEGVCFGLIGAISESGMFERISHDDEWWLWKRRKE